MIDLAPEHLEKVRTILREYVPQCEVRAFGSRVSWTAKDYSDLDLAVVCSGKLSDDTLSHLKEAFEESDLPFRVDVLDWQAISREFQKVTEKQYEVIQGAKSKNAAGEWRQAALGDIKAPTPNALVGGPFGSNLVSADYVDHGVPVIRGQNMGERWVTGEFAYVTPAKAASLEANLARPGDIVFTQRGTLGQVSMVPEEPFDRYLISQSQMKLTVDRNKVDPLFIYYVFRTPDQQEYIRLHAIQTGVPHTNLGILRDTPVPIPPLSEQRAIARILGTLDDKIELNRRMNETLEAMARALFKSWFVDFDPVRAKAEGRDPGLPKPLADLFPHSFSDSKLGKIPKGWKVESLEQHFQAVRGVSYRGSGLSDSGVPLHNLNSVYEGGGYKCEGLKRYIGEYREQHQAEPGDVIVANTEQGHDRLLIGYAAIVPRQFAHGIFSHHIYRLRPRPDSYLTSQFLIFLMNWPQMHDIVSGYANGTTVNMLPIEGVQKPEFVVPPESIIRHFDIFTRHAQERAECSVQQSCVLAALRDTLLPKLISGEIRIKDAERIAAGA
jgi:type I restriction enzyme S subunit